MKAITTLNLSLLPHGHGSLSMSNTRLSSRVRREHDVGGAVTPRGFEFEDDVALATVGLAMHALVQAEPLIIGA